jgi:hypothetical protein
MGAHLPALQHRDHLLELAPPLVHGIAVVCLRLDNSPAFSGTVPNHPMLIHRTRTEATYGLRFR